LSRVTVPAIIREMDDDTATILMVNANLPQEKVLPSEMAWARREDFPMDGKNGNLLYAPKREPLEYNNNRYIARNGERSAMAALIPITALSADSATIPA
jgi:hypothetical protein